MSALTRRAGVAVFLAFALAYFLAALVRAVTATLSPVLTQEFLLTARDLGLLAGGYFLGFSVMQLPLGNWLDRHGPKRVILGFLALSTAGCLAFSLAQGFSSLLAARVICGAGLSACLMAPLTGFRRWFLPGAQQRANSWMLMTGSLGMVASTLPVQWLTPLVGWRPLFWSLALLIVMAMAVIAWQVPHWESAAASDEEPRKNSPRSYAAIWAHPYFRRTAPLAFFVYGGLLAMQTLWAGPWLVRVAGFTPMEAAGGLFWINLCMLVTFWAWGLVNPWLMRRGWSAERLMAWTLPLNFMILGAIVVWPAAAATAMIAAYCVSCTVVALSQPAVALAFEQSMAGRALSAFNLVIFCGVFVVQWGIGLLVDGFGALGLPAIGAFQAALAVHLACCVACYLWFLLARSHNRQP